jgi:hypothetical protein
MAASGGGTKRFTPTEQDIDALRRSVGVGFKVEAVDVETRWGNGPVIRECVQVLDGDRRVFFTPALVQTQGELMLYHLDEIAQKFGKNLWWVKR